MFYVYLFASILGGALLTFSLFAGEGHESGHDHDGSLGFISIRFLTYFLGFGGLTGLLLAMLTPTSTPLTAALAAGVGTGAGLMARSLVRRAMSSGTGGTVRHEDLVGKPAIVMVPFGRAATGSVRLEVRQATIDLLARCDDHDLSAGAPVLIVDFKDGVATVAPDPAPQKRT